jgi:Trans-aconitate methyltransferase
MQEMRGTHGMNGKRKFLSLLPHRCRSVVGAILVHFSRSTEAQFTTIYEFGVWRFRGPKIPHSGPGVRVEKSVLARQALSEVLHDHDITTMLDAACGDLTWMPLVLRKYLEVQYTGMDIVRELVEKNQHKYPHLQFYHADLIQHVPNRFDLIHSRATLNHLKTANVLRVLENFRRSGSRYLLTNCSPRTKRNIDLIAQNGMYRGINWLLPPYNLKPIRTWEENTTSKMYILVKLNQS